MLQHPDGGLKLNAIANPTYKHCDTVVPPDDRDQMDKEQVEYTVEHTGGFMCQAGQPRLADFTMLCRIRDCLKLAFISGVFYLVFSDHG